MAYLEHLGILIGIFAILGLSLNLVVGYTGLLSVAHAGFFGVGAYVTAVLLTTTGINFFLALLIAAIATALVSLLVGLVLSRFDDDYFAIASLGFNVIVFTVFLSWQNVTRGPLGIPGISRPELFNFTFESNTSFFVLAFVSLALVYSIAHFITRSSFGRVLKAIREDEKAIQVFGYNTFYFKLTVFMIGAAFASIAGSLYASYITFIEPSTFFWTESVFILAIIILGGLANNKGALLGALILVLLPEMLRFVGMPPEVAAQMRQILYGLILVALMLYKPQGILGKFRL